MSEENGETFNALKEIFHLEYFFNRSKREMKKETDAQCLFEHEMPPIN